MKQRMYHEAAGCVQMWKDAQIAARSPPIPSSVLGNMKDNRSESGSETDCTLTGAETSRDITGTETGVRSATDTGGTIAITTSTTARTGTARHTATRTGTGTLSAAERGLHSTLTGTVTTSALTTHTTTAAGTTGAGIGGATATTMRTKLTTTGSGGRRDEIRWPRRTRAMAETGTVPRPLQVRYQIRTRLLGTGPPHLDPLSTGRITSVGKNILVRRAIARKNTKRAKRKRSQRIKTDTVTAGKSSSDGKPPSATDRVGQYREHQVIDMINTLMSISHIPARK